jgi:hypothetical protein
MKVIDQQGCQKSLGGSVLVGPGLTMFTLIFLAASSNAPVLAIAFNAALLAEYTENRCAITCAAIDDKKTTDALFTYGNIATACAKLSWVSLVWSFSST